MQNDPLNNTTNSNIENQPFYKKKTTLITIGVIASLIVIAAVTVPTVIYFLRKRHEHGIAPHITKDTTPSITPTPSSQPLSTFKLRQFNNDGQCLYCNMIQLSIPGFKNCVLVGSWAYDSTTKRVIYSTNTFETCIANPSASGDSVFGSFFMKQCEGVVFNATERQIKAEKTNLCINFSNGLLSWGSCNTAYTFNL